MDMIWLYLLAGLLVFKFINNLSKYLRTRHYLSRYANWLSNPDNKLLESKAQVVKLLKDAGVSDSSFPTAQPVGYGRLATFEASTLTNFPSKTADFAYATNRMFREAIGTYRSRMLETISPLYWIETIIYLPREALAYTGVPPESVVVKVFQLVWWISTTLLAVVWLAFRPELLPTVRDWLTEL